MQRVVDHMQDKDGICGLYKRSRKMVLNLLVEDPPTVPLEGLGICLEGTDISLGKFFPEYFTTLTLDVHTGVVSTEDIVEIWESVREEAIVKVRGNKNTDLRVAPRLCNLPSKS
jgi:hypothetical protein